MTVAVSACTEADRARVGAAASDVGAAAGEVGDAAGQLGDELGGGQEEQAPDSGGDASGAEEPAEPDAAQPADTAGQDDQGGLPLWLLALLAVAALLLILGIIAAARRRGEATQRRRRLREEVLLDTDWLIGAASERPSTVDAAPRARDVRVRTDRLSDALRRLEAQSDRRVAEAVVELRMSAGELARVTIARLDDVAAARAPSTDLGIDEVLQRTQIARDWFADVS